MHEHTQWLNASTGSCDDAHFGELYAELKKIALGRMAIERSGQALEATELVHEAWLRLQKSTPERWRDRSQFYGAAAEAMRRILVETARRRLAAKRGGGEKDLPLDGVQLPAPLADERLIGIHEVLDELEAEDELKAKIVKLRFFSGMNHDEIAALLAVNEKTVRRHWALAKLWLYRAMEKSR
ncbi:ECF-type sigma factor [Luteolibacter luteus]|uniref:Sigma-70 family RNA polymerase sigma factor n=1 Tax=Luteolibacter luteus TaxID=2728835 RepID=A0A858RNG2_9BACT|nr:ECF-type sigma factor [Luteolibacter luteus]QJE98402.1 sigma-70 family RNA polymerase sigma factor [Luteolibacter luteus]